MTLVVENKKRKAVVEELLTKGYKPDPVKAWKTRTQIDKDDEQPEEEEEEEARVAEEAPSSSKKLADAGIINNILFCELMAYFF